MGLVNAVGSATGWWATYYGDHQMVSLVIRYIHLAALMIGGGTALAIDRVVLGSARTRIDDRRRAAVTAMKGSHRVVVPALGVVTASGILMAAADWSTFAASRLFWIKMISFAFLVFNGAALVAVERAYARRADLSTWRRVVLVSGVSCALWLFILWIGEWLMIAA